MTVGGLAAAYSLVAHALAALVSAFARSMAAYVAAVGMSFLLVGCASLPFFGSKAGATDAAGTTASAPDAAASVAAAERAEYQFEVAAPDPLRALLVNYLDLSRFQTAPTTEGITTAELERLRIAAPAQARALLETEGYFNAEVAVERVANTSGKPLLRMTVQPGPRTLVTGFTLDVVGDLEAAVQAGNATAVAELATLRRSWGMQPGEPFRDAEWSSAKNAALARLRAEGYAAATWSGTNAKVDAEANTAQLSLVAESGPLYRLGAIRIEGVNRYDEDAVRKLATFRAGEPYTEKLLLDYQERLQKLGLFEGTSVELDPNPETAAAAPVTIRLKELQKQQATVGVGYSANTGPRFSLEHIDRRVFGTRWIAKNKFEIGPDLKSWSGELTSYPLDGLYRNLLSGNVQNLRTTDETLNSWSVRAGRTQDTPRIERLYYGEAVHARVVNNDLTSDANAISGNYNWVFRDLDNVLLPTRGYSLSAQAALGVARGERSIGGNTETGRGPFGRAYGRITWYKPLGSDWYATVRGEAGELFTNSVVSVPDTLLFRAGGDDSVRGYGYRSLGPTAYGILVSGRVLMTGSVEVARPISPKYPAFWWAAFLDAGNAADRWTNLNPALGYGVGLRWRSPVGPLRLDLAYGQKVQQVRVHLSVGIAF